MLRCAAGARAGAGLIDLIQPVDGAAAPEPEAWMLEEGRRSFVRCPLFLEDVED